MAGIGVQDHRNHCSGSRNPRSRSRNRCSRWIGISVQDGPEYALKCLRADDIYDNRPIIEDIWRCTNEARILIAELTGRNANVFYETGIAHTIGKEVILISQSMEDVPFDLKHLRCIVYEYTPRGIANLEENLKNTVLNVLSRRG